MQLKGHNSGIDAFAAKLDSTGAMTWNTFLGGTNEDKSYGVDLDGGENVYVVGYSNVAWSCSPTPCTTRSFTPGNYDGFVAKLSSSGALIWNSFLGGGAYDAGYDIWRDTSGNLLAVGRSLGGWSCATDCTERDYTGGADAFVSKMDSSGALVWNTFLGTSGDDEGRGIVLDGSGNSFVVGFSAASWGNPERGYTNLRDAFAARLDPSGVLIKNTFLGGSGNDDGYGIARDGVGNITISGRSDITWGNPVRTFTGTNYDAFAAGVDLFTNHLYLSIVMRN